MRLGRILGSGLAALALLASTPAQAGDKYALGMFHFNIQYVAGGMVGYYATPNPAIDLDAEQVEDQIVTQSFAPVVALYAKHPTWGIDLEMQGYMLDVLAARHPDVLAELRTLAKSGQIEVDSFHYSDQFFIAHPRDDWSRSQERTVATFKKYDVPLGTSVFCQEGQAGTVMAHEMKDRGYATMVWPKNLWIYQHGDFAPDPLYQFGEIGLVVGGKSVSYQSGATAIDVTWTYLDDGELLATDGIDPYLPDLFHTSQKALDDYEANLTALEAQGYQITTVAKYAAAVKGAVTPSAAPPLLDGTWQPGSTDSSHKWLGGGGLWTADERDNDVRSLADVVHRELAAAETIAQQAGIDASAALDDAHRLLELGEVSDASGINPFRGEIEYGIGHLAEALRIARDVVREGKDELALGKEIVVDPAAGTVKAGRADERRGKATEAPLALTVSSSDRAATESWETIDASLARVAVAFGVGDATDLSVRFPGAMDDVLVTTRALDDTVPASFQRSDFTFDSYYLPLPIGVVGLGGGKFVIEDQAYVHLAAQVFRENGDLVFVDGTQTAGEAVNWVFYLFTGSADDAVALARSINDRRALTR